MEFIGNRGGLQWAIVVISFRTDIAVGLTPGGLTVERARLVSPAATAPPAAATPPTTTLTFFRRPACFRTPVEVLTLRRTLLILTTRPLPALVRASATILIRAILVGAILVGAILVRPAMISPTRLLRSIGVLILGSILGRAIILPGKLRSSREVSIYGLT
jgi:hypothetical protein